MEPELTHHHPSSPGENMTAGSKKQAMLTDGLHHVAILTSDTARLVHFYETVFDAVVSHTTVDGPVRLTFLDIGPNTELNIFEIDGNQEAERQTPMFGRGRIDHLGVRATSFDAFVEIRRRLIEQDATDGFVTDFGPVLSLFFTDPDGLECEVCVPNPDATPNRRNPPGTPATKFATT
jgi:catechol 2,3-dioxygenase-like lactoylglutathione lyase family enzyme